MLIMPIATVILTISSSLKCCFSGSKSSSGAPFRAISVTASVQPSSARSLSVKTGDSCHAEIR